MISPTLLLPLTLLLLTQTPTTHAKKFNLEWFTPETPADVFPNETASVGDKISFEWTQELPHNVLIHPSGDCNVTGAIFVGDVFDETEYVIKETDAGKTLTFACDVEEHCSTGQIVHFMVAANPAASPTSSPVADTPTDVPPSSPVADTPTDVPPGYVSSPVASPTSSPVTSAAMFRGDGVRRVAVAIMVAAVSLCIIV
mmetsp:Transcript_35138/g.41928  ORF Transcript_35138/g.41928 Transcript_35138/m.41928 type:complete len:199 (-) Transcript_35138:134-730(-)